MDDINIFTDPDYGLDGSIVVTGRSTLNRANSAKIGQLGAISMASTHVGLPLTVAAVLRAMNAVFGAAPESTAVEAPPKPKKPPPSLPVEAWATREFDAEQAHEATLALCRGNN